MLLLPSLSFNFIGTLSAILIAHVFYNTTIIIRVVGNALSSLDPKLEAAARSLGADSFHVWWYVTFPLLRPAIMASSLLVFLFDFTSFGVILLLGGSQFATLEVEIYLRVLKLPNLSLAALLCDDPACLHPGFFDPVCPHGFTLDHADRATFGSGQPPQTKITAGKNSMYQVSSSCWQPFSSCLFLPSRSAPSSASKRTAVSAARSNMVSQRIITRNSSSTGAVRSFMCHRSGQLLNSLGYAGTTVLLSLLLGFPAALALAKPTRLEKVLDPLDHASSGFFGGHAGTGIHHFLWRVA